MFGDRDHDRQVASGAAGAALFGGLLGIFIYMKLLNGYYELFRRFPKSTGGVTVLVLLALIFAKQIGYGINWFTVREHLPDGQYTVEHQGANQAAKKFALEVKDGKISRDGGKSFEEVKWERDVKKGAFVMNSGNTRYAFYELKDKDGQRYFHAVDENRRYSSGPSFDRYTWTSPEQLAAKAMAQKKSELFIKSGRLNYEVGSWRNRAWSAVCYTLRDKVMAGDPIAAQAFKNVTTPKDLVAVAEECVAGKAYSKIPMLADVDLEPIALKDLEEFAETGKTPALDEAVAALKAEAVRVTDYTQTVTREWEKLKEERGKQVAQSK